MRCFLLISNVMHNRSFLLLDISGLQILIFQDGIEAGAVLVDVGQVAVTEDPGIGVRGLQAAQQPEQGAFLPWGAGVGGVAVLVEASFVADAERVLVVAYGVGTDQLFVARLVGPAVAGDVVVVARESEAIRVTADECCHGKATVTARSRTVNDNQINVPHDCTKNELMIAVSTVMMNWMMVFQRFMFLKIPIVVNL